jgi:hypothetical protein
MVICPLLYLGYGDSGARRLREGDRTDIKRPPPKVVALTLAAENSVQGVCSASAFIQELRSRTDRVGCGQ